MKDNPPILDKLAYSIPNLAKAVDVSVQTIRNEINDGNLIPSYIRTEPRITAIEAKRWLDTRPAERN